MLARLFLNILNLEKLSTKINKHDLKFNNYQNDSTNPTTYNSGNVKVEKQ